MLLGFASFAIEQDSDPALGDALRVLRGALVVGEPFRVMAEAGATWTTLIIIACQANEQVAGRLIGPLWPMGGYQRAKSFGMATDGDRAAQQRSALIIFNMHFAALTVAEMPGQLKAVAMIGICPINECGMMQICLATGYDLIAQARPNFDMAPWGCVIPNPTSYDETTAVPNLAARYLGLNFGRFFVGQL